MIKSIKGYLTSKCEFVMPPKKVVYLFGAGATQGEAQYEAGLGEGLSLENVSEKAISLGKEEQKLQVMLSEIERDDIKDIELYISLLESVNTKKYSELASALRSFFCQSIQENLISGKTPIEPSLTMALLEMHEKLAENEKFIGAISLNYDNMLDRAFNEVFKGINYGIKCKCEKAVYNVGEEFPLLIKLHGSFNWKKGFRFVLIDEEQAQVAKQAEMLWIPPSIEKERDAYPFNLLWGKAFQMLDCDILRIVGCKLSQNDWGLISLLFNTQLEPGGVYEIQLICSHKGGENIRKRNGFLKNVKILGELENCQDLIEPPLKNTFESWLRVRLGLLREEGVPLDDLELPHVNKILGVRSDWKGK